MRFQAWEGNNISPFSWTNIMAFSLTPGSYLVMYTCQVGQIKSSNGSIFGIRIRWNQKM